MMTSIIRTNEMKVLYERDRPPGVRLAYVRQRERGHCCPESAALILGFTMLSFAKEWIICTIFFLKLLSRDDAQACSIDALFLDLLNKS